MFFPSGKKPFGECYTQLMQWVINNLTYDCYLAKKDIYPLIDADLRG